MKLKILLITFLLHNYCNGASKSLSKPAVSQVVAQAAADARGKHEADVKTASQAAGAGKTWAKVAAGKEISTQKTDNLQGAAQQAAGAGPGQAAKNVISAKESIDAMQKVSYVAGETLYDGAVEGDNHALLRSAVSVIKLNDDRFVSYIGFPSGKVIVWDLKKNKEDRMMTVLYQPDSVYHSILPIGDRLFASGDFVEMFNLKTDERKCLTSYGMHGKLHRLKDGRLACSSYGVLDPKTLIFDFNPNRNPVCIEGSHSIELKNGNILTFSFNELAKIWNISNPKNVICVTTLPKIDFMSIVELGDGKLVTSSYGFKVDVWDLTFATHKEKKTATLENAERDEKSRDYFSTIMLLKDGRLALETWDGLIRIWDLSDKDGKYKFSTICCEACCENGASFYLLSELSDDRLAIWSSNCVIHIFDLKSGCFIADFECPPISKYSKKPSSLVELSDGTLVVCDGYIRTWVPNTINKAAISDSKTKKS